MRRSVEQGDLGWDVWLDGVLQKNVVMADDETGEVERFALDDDGQPIFGPAGITTETVRGKVEIRPVGEGLVAPVWSDAGEVTSPTVRACFGNVPLYWDGATFEVIGRLVEKYASLLKKQADPNAKPALHALTRGER